MTSTDLYAAADALGLDYAPGFDDDALALRVKDGECDGLGTLIGVIPDRGGESGYYACSGCIACTPAGLRAMIAPIAVVRLRRGLYLGVPNNRWPS